MFHQCHKTPGHGPDGIFCKIHDPAAEKARSDASQAKYDQESARRVAIYSAPEKLAKAEQRIAALELRLAAFERGEYVCQTCGLRQDSEATKQCAKDPSF